MQLGVHPLEIYLAIVHKIYIKTKITIPEKNLIMLIEMLECEKWRIPTSSRLAEKLTDERFGQIPRI